MRFDLRPGSMSKVKTSPSGVVTVCVARSTVKTCWRRRFLREFFADSGRAPCDAVL